MPRVARLSQNEEEQNKYFTRINFPERNQFTVTHERDSGNRIYSQFLRLRSFKSHYTNYGKWLNHAKWFGYDKEIGPDTIRENDPDSTRESFRIRREKLFEYDKRIRKKSKYDRVNDTNNFPISYYLNCT